MAEASGDLGPVEVLERFANGASLVRLVAGHRRGELCLVAGGISLEVAEDLGAASPAAADRARELLTGQLSDRQRDRLARTGTFWVLTPVAWVRLGTLYDLRVRTRRAPSVERSTCVVTEGFGRRPLDDLWTELLAWLAVDPGGFLRIGNPQPCREQLRAPRRRPDLEAWLRHGRDRWRTLRRDGLELESAHLAFELATALDRAGRPRWARPFAQRGWEQILVEAARFPDDEHVVIEAHEPLHALARRLATI